MTSTRITGETVTTEILKHGNVKLSVREYNDSSDYDAASFDAVDKEVRADTRGIEIDLIMPRDERPSHSTLWVHGADRVELSDGVIVIRDRKDRIITKINTSTFGPGYYQNREASGCTVT